MAVNVKSAKKDTKAKSGKVDIYLAHGVSHRFMGLAFRKGTVYSVNEDVAEHLLGLEISGIQKFEEAGVKLKDLPRQAVDLALPKNALEVGDDDEITAHLNSGNTQTQADAGTDGDGIDTGASADNDSGTDGAVSV